MNNSVVRILLVDDDEDYFVLTKGALQEIKAWRSEIDWVATYKEGLEKIHAKAHDIYLIDYRLGEHNGLDLLREAIAGGCRAPFILLTAAEDYDIDVKAMELGAVDYLTKGAVQASILERSIRYGLHRKQMETLLIQAEKMAGIGQFAACIGHDLNNPIAVILGYSQTLIRELPETDPSMEPLKAIAQEGLRCKTLVQNLLAFSRGGRQASKMAFEDFNKAIAGALSLVETFARSKSVQVVRPDYLELPAIQMNANEIQQVIINLCTNAIDAMPEGGRLIFKLFYEGSQVALSIQDTGTGIPPEIRDHIFEAFFTTKEIGKGTGLGLSIVSDIVKKHNGQIDLQSEVGKGTIFTVRLPIKQTSAQEPAEPLAA